jgi:hypothetical protein
MKTYRLILLLTTVGSFETLFFISKSQLYSARLKKPLLRYGTENICMTYFLLNLVYLYLSEYINTELSQTETTEQLAKRVCGGGCINVGN